jgi:hypothetical protein
MVDIFSQLISSLIWIYDVVVFMFLSSAAYDVVLVH